LIICGMKIFCLSRFLLLLFILGFFSVYSSAQESQKYSWTRFRGSDGMGVDTERNIPVQWDSSAYRWEVALPGLGHSSPVVWDGIIFVTSSVDSSQTGYVLAIDEKEGQILWQHAFSLSELSMHKDNNLASATPAVDLSHVYVIWYAKEKITLTALSHEGDVQWQSEFDGIEARHGGGSSLMLTDQAVVFTREQEEGSQFAASWVAVEKSSGQILWELARESSSRNSFSTPFPVRNVLQEKLLLFTSEAHGFTIIDAETGRVVMENPDILTHRVVASPIYSDGLAVGCRKGQTVVLEMDLNTRQVADTALYTLAPNLSPYVPTPIIVQGLLYLFLDNGSVACVKLNSGELLWRERPAGPLYGSPVCLGGRLYCISKAGEVLVLQAGSKYELLGINALGEGSYSTPVMCNSGMVLRSFSKLRLLPNIPNP
jgi:hypothetical protein